MLLNEVMSGGPISIEGVAMDALEYADQWLGQYDINNVYKEVGAKLDGFLKKYKRNVGQDAAFIQQYRAEIGNAIAKMLQRRAAKQQQNQQQQPPPTYYEDADGRAVPPPQQQASYNQGQR